MADEQTQHSDLIDDAIREAEQQLEAKLEALRMSALGDLAPPSDPAAAHLRPTGSASAWSDAAPSPTASTEPTAWDSTDDDWQDQGGWEEPSTASRAQDAPFGNVAWQEPSASGEPEWQQPESSGAWHVEPSPTWSSEERGNYTPGGTPTGGDTGAGWQDAVIQPTGSSSHSGERQSEGTPTRWSGGVEDLVEEYAEPQTPAWMPATPAASGPTETELQFWAQTRTTLRRLEEGNEVLPRNVAGAVTAQFEQVMRDELAAPSAAIRQLQQQLPGYAEHVSRTVADELEAPTAAIRQLQEELPLHIERLQRGLNTAVNEDLPAQLDRIERKVHVSINEDLAAQVDRLQRSVQSAIGEELPAQLERIERNVHSTINEDLPAQLERMQHTLDSAVGQALPRELQHAVGPAGSCLGVGYQHQRGLRRPRLRQQQIEHQRGSGAVEVARGLFGKEHGRAVHQCPRNRDAL